MKFLKKMKISSMEKKHSKMMEQAMHAQRNGNIALYAKLSAEAENLYKEIEILRKELQ